MLDRTIFICQLPEKEQTNILVLLNKTGMQEDDMEAAMNSRIQDLEEVLVYEVGDFTLKEETIL